jgi:SAM-dependent methyltransferase
MGETDVPQREVWKNAYAVAQKPMRCPVCSNVGTTPAFSSTDFLLRTTSRVFQLSRCTACRSLFLDPAPNEAEIPGFYPPRYWWAPGSRALTRLETTYRRLALRDHVVFVEQAAAHASAGPSPVLLLDVGCGPGTLIGILQSKGLDVLGLDLSPEAAAIAARENGVQVITATLAGASFPDASFGVVTMFHVLEHVLDPRAILTEVHRVLRPGGRVVLQVPNIDSWQSQLFGARWWGLHVPRHIVDFSASSVQGLLDSSGFVVERVRHFNLRDNAPALASSLCPSLDPQVRAMRQHRIGVSETAVGSWVRHALYLLLVGAATPFALAEAAAGAGATVMIEASKA